MRKLALALALSATVALPVIAKDETLSKAVSASHRTADFVSRDKYRRPQETLEFAGIKPGMTVVEVSPGGGYWTEILAPYLKGSGTYYTAISPASASPRAAQAAENWKKKLEGNKELYGNVKVSEFGRGSYDVAPAGTADVILTSRNLHNWIGAGFAADALAGFHKALKPGGVLIISDHRGSVDQPQDPKAASGYVREDYAKQLAEKAGFKFVESSEVLANPKDTKNWEKGVWTLPPTLAMGEQDRAKYVGIGEADNFLLKFQKPAK